MTTTSSKANPPSSRRIPSSPSPSISPTLARGTTARSAASARLPTLNSSNARRPLTKPAPPTPAVGGELQDILASSLKQETDQKEQLLLQLQDKDQLISNYLTENSNLTSALSGAETRLNELYGEQSRWEMDLAQRIDISEKLREQVRELEKEKRDLQRRYNEQTATFEAERQALYDNEQHLKSRIQSLTHARKRAESTTAPVEAESETESLAEEEPSAPLPNTGKELALPDFSDPENEPAEMTSLKLELSTLSTSYSSLQSTLILMQTQLVDLKRVNQELQEENESYMILLREKTLSGQFDLMKQVGDVAGSDDDEGNDNDQESTDVSSMRSLGRSTLDRVEEESPEGLSLELPGDISELDVPLSARGSRQGRPERKRTLSHGRRGESLADLPITGPGLDLAAELGRAENKDILAGNSIDDKLAPSGIKNKRPKKHQDVSKISGVHSTGLDPAASNVDIDALRTEVKSLKDANKALSLYASKIIDRIIAQEGFEHVLAIDYDKEPPTPSTAIPHPNVSRSLPFSHSRPRPQSVNFGRSSSNPGVEMKTSSPNPRADAKAKRRSLSFDWTSFSLFNAEKKPEPSPNLRPLTLKPGAVPVTGARKLDNLEDEEDKKERERLHATMKLMGIQPVLSQPSPPVPPQMEPSATSTATPSTKSNRRFSLFGSKNIVGASDSSSMHSATSALNPGDHIPLNLTEEALEHAEAESSLAALDARERDLSAEIARGSGGGFTEIARRSSRKGRRSAGGSSGSTVWSAGMSGNEND